MMRVRTLAFVTLAFVLPLAVGAQQQVFRSTSDLVPVFVTVTDKSGRLVPDLTRESFQVFDNGRLQQLTLFDNSPQPLRLIILIDISGSMFQNATLIRRATTELLKNLAPVDLAKVGTFGHEISFTPEWTRDVNVLVSGLPQRIEMNTPTPLWSAADLALTEFATTTPGRRVVLILTDSKDSGPAQGMKFLTQVQVSDRAQREDVMIYGVGLRSAISAGMDVRTAIANSYPDPSLGVLADDTGGGYFELKSRDNLSETFARVAEELRRQYMIGFAPPARDGKNHKIEIKLPSGMKPRARKSYTAPK